MSTIVDLLVERPDAELCEMEARAAAERDRLNVELDQIREARTRKAPPPKPRRRRPRGKTRQRVLDVIASGDEPMSPSDVIAALSEGDAPGGGSIYNMLARLVNEGELVRPAEGMYELATRNGPSLEPSSGPTENEASDPLFAGARPQEGS